VLHCVDTGRFFHGRLDLGGEATFTGSNSTLAITGGTGELDGAKQEGALTVSVGGTIADGAVAHSSAHVAKNCSQFTADQLDAL